ncbi:Serine/threonine-protein phosphatase 7 long form [Glycine max]|nr:Serine/threonine-protein phosphatase 7 long form [Glycine max]
MPAPHPLIEPLLIHTGFANVAKLRHFKIDHHLVTALVERWRPEMHPFHLPVEECTITLEDVALQLGIRVDDKTRNRVHLMYITVLVDLDRVRWYGWGSACLATLYREMCRATDPDAKTMGGYASLLQSWAWYRMAFIAARVNRKPLYPLVTR